jgi:hypothetical protein
MSLLVKQNTFHAMPCSQTEWYMTLNHHVIEIIPRNYTSYHPDLFSSLLDCTLNPRLFHCFLQGGPLRSFYIATHQGSIDVDMIPHLTPGTWTDPSVIIITPIPPSILWPRAPISKCIQLILHTVGSRQVVLPTYPISWYTQELLSMWHLVDKN